jgi:hypothetical protein
MAPKSDSRIDWDSSGITSETGELDRPIASGEIWVPRSIELKGNKLVWESGGWRVTSAKAGMLEQFIKIANSPKETIRRRVLRYARQWGVLRICNLHRKPLSHTEPVEFGRWVFEDYAKRCFLLEEGGKHWEPISAWQSYAKQARAILNLAASLHLGRVGSMEDWAVVTRTRNPRNLEELYDRNAARHTIASAVDIWLRWGAVEVNFNWDDPKPTVVIGSNNLFGNLAVQLMLAAGRTQGFVSCSACGNQYIPKRRPRIGERHYCHNCGRAAAVRDASAAYRKRQSEGPLR